MSMNISIRAERQITVEKTGKPEIQSIRFDCWQTPTEDSYKIIAQPDPLQAYRDWVLSRCEDQTIDVFAEDDVFHLGEPTGTTVYNSGKEHVHDLETWINKSQMDGYEVKVIVW